MMNNNKGDGYTGELRCDEASRRGEYNSCYVHTCSYFKSTAWAQNMTCNQHAEYV